MRLFVKICGITTPDAARTAATTGADAVGFVFAESARRVTAERARELAAPLPSSVLRVAVLHYPSAAAIDEVLAGFAPDIVQCEPSSTALDALQSGRIRLLPVFHDSPRLLAEIERFRRGTPAFSGPVLLEGAGRGGRGVGPDLARAADAAGKTPLVLAGGLNPENVAAAIARVCPFGVDVSSGVESAPGIKDPDKISAFLAAVREAESPPLPNTPEL